MPPTMSVDAAARLISEKNTTGLFRFWFLENVNNSKIAGSGGPVKLQLKTRDLMLGALSFAHN
jgi:hypothetical protein